MSTVGDSTQEILGEVAAIIREVIGEEWADDVAIGMETSFADLELESIEIVALGEGIQNRYPAVDFASWLSGMELEDVITLRVGQVVEHVAQCR